MLSKALGLLGAVDTVRIARERAEARRSIPRTSISRVEEGRVDSKHAEGLPPHLTCTWNMLMAPCAEIPMPEKKVHECQKSLEPVSLP